MAFILLLNLILIFVSSVMSNLKSQALYVKNSYGDKVVHHKINQNFLKKLHEVDIKETQIGINKLDTGQTNRGETTLQRIRREIETTTKRFDHTNGEYKEKRQKKQEWEDGTPEQKSNHSHHYSNENKDNVKNNHFHQHSTENEENVNEDEDDDFEDSEFINAEENFNMKWFGRDTLDYPVIKKRMVVTFPAGRPGAKIGLNLPYEKKGNLLRFPVGYKIPLARMRKYAESVAKMQQMVAKEILKRINRTNIALTVQKKMVRSMKRKNRTRANRRSARRKKTEHIEAKHWGIGEDSHASVQDKLERFLKERKGNGTLTKKERAKATEEFFLVEAFKGYVQNKKDGLLTKEQDRAIIRNFVRYFQAQEEHKQLEQALRVKNNIKSGDMDEVHKNDKRMFKDALDVYFPKKDRRPTVFNSPQDILEADNNEQRKGGEERNNAAQNTNKITARNDRPSRNTVKYSEDTDDELWLLINLSDRLIKRENGETITIEEERRFNKDLEEFLIKRKTEWILSKRKMNPANAVMSKQEWEIIMEEALYQEAMQEFGRQRKVRLLSKDEEQTFLTAMTNYLEKKQMRKDAEKEGRNSITDANQWYGTMEEYLYNKAVEEYKMKKKDGTLTEDEEKNYLQSIQAFNKMKDERIVRNTKQLMESLSSSTAAVNPAHSAAARAAAEVDTSWELQYAKLHKDFSISTDINPRGWTWRNDDSDILGKSYWKAKKDYEKMKKKETSTMSDQDRTMLAIANQQVHERLQEYWKGTTSQPPWRGRRTTFRYLG